MPEVRRRRVVDEDKPVRRKRDVVEEVEEDEEDDVDATERPVRARKATKATKRTTKKRATTRRRAPEPEPEEDEDEEEPEEDEEDYEEEEEDEDEEEEEEEPPPPRRRKKAAATKKAAPRRRRAEPEEDEDEEDEEPPPRRRKASGTKKAAPKKRAASPIHYGQKGAEEVTGGGGTRLTLTQKPSLIKVLEPEPLCSFPQHWVSAGPGQGDRPYVCLGVNCPLCDTIGDSPSKTVLFNVLHLPEDGPPVNKILQVGVKAFKAFVAAATPRGKDSPVYDKDFWAVSRSGKQQQSQTNFNQIKERDLDEDWGDIFEHFDEELEDLIAEAQENLFEADAVVQVHTAKQLREIARYAADDDEEDE